MAHAYRTRLEVPPEGPRDEQSRLGPPTLAFGLICVFGGLALAGSARPSMVLLAGGAGTAAIVARRGIRERRSVRIERRASPRRTSRDA